MSEPATDAPHVPGLTFVEPLGVGAVANAYLYEEKVTGRGVAVKVWRQVLAVGGARDAFVAAGRAWVALSSHPHLVKMDDAGVTPSGHAFVVMEHAANGSIEERLRARPLTPTEVLRTIIPLCGALESVHRAGLAHGAVNAAHVVTLESGEAALAERVFPEAGVGVETGATAPSEHGDLYALAALAYTMLAGAEPFAGVAEEDSRPSVPERILRGDIPDPLQRLLRGALGADLEGRPTSAADFGRKLQRVERDVHVHLTPMQLGVAGIEPTAVTAPAGLAAVATAMPPSAPSAPVPSADSPSLPSSLPSHRRAKADMAAAQAEREPLQPLPPGQRRTSAGAPVGVEGGDLEDTTVSVRRAREPGEALRPGDHDVVRSDGQRGEFPHVVTTRAPGGRAQRVAYVPVPGEVREADRYALRTAPPALPRVVRPSSSSGPVADTAAAVRASQRASVEAARRARGLLAAAVVGGAALMGAAVWGIWTLLVG